MSYNASYRDRIILEIVQASFEFSLLKHLLVEKEDASSDEACHFPMMKGETVMHSSFSSSFLLYFSDGESEPTVML
jgi:hypothetical protein